MQGLWIPSILRLVAVMLLAPAIALASPCSSDFAAVEPGNKFALTPMHKRYEGEKGRVVYLDPASARRYKVRVSSGQIVDFKGKSLDGTYIFVMDGKGELFVTNHNQGGVFHHSSLLAGKPVASAGTMTFNRGKLVRITSSSGHYRPTKRYFEQVLTELQERGVPTKGVPVVAYDEKARRALFVGVATGVAGVGYAVGWKEE